MHEVDRIARIIRNDGITYGIFDSVGFACDGPPEAAESALGYFRAVRQLRIGGLHIAHVSKAENGDQRPFGSAFWHNSARATWFAKAAGQDEPGELTIGLLNRKSNLGALLSPLAYRFEFRQDRTVITPMSAASVESFAKDVPLWKRIVELLKARSPLLISQIAEELDAKPDSVEKTLKRRKGMFVSVSGADHIARWTLLEGRADSGRVVQMPSRFSTGQVVR